MAVPLSFSRGWRQHLSVLAFALLVAVPSAAGTAQTISLPAPGKTARVAGHLRGLDDRCDFTFDAAANTRLKLDITGPGPMRWMITFPSGKKDGAPGGGSLELLLTETGSYLLTVSESSMGEAWRSKFKIVIHVDK
jgi:hypothetical protein